MKIKLLAIAVAGILLSGCNDDNVDASSKSVQAFDPAVQNMTAVAACDDGTTETSKTDFTGNAKFFNLAPQFSPETCSFQFTGLPGSNAVDVSNGKSMVGVTYSIPKGMAQANSPITASPMTTLIAKELAATGAVYSEATATTVLTSLGLGSLLNNGVSVTKLLSNTEAVLKELTTTNPTDASLLAATTAVLSDVLTASPDATAEALTTTASTLSENVIAANPAYPTSATGDTVYVDFDETEVKDYVQDVEDKIADPSLPEPTPPTPDLPKAKPVDPPTPPATGGGTGGGTGGSGGGSGD
ncbi:serine/threonine protein kinase [Moritella sp. Urea-trap-13]|uniref:serine/threonine protein kinase n=1 Tax=Moritella sp. Urea-trap-13 TaxID=2058327 RepID=UPI000C3370C7|nr:serine/threonine protein kinase [Moritella sp. Urea-trap-13]PKH07991.1 serine/threonine protein kinase [Moritella sp. Urea-trap-13]